MKSPKAIFTSKAIIALCLLALALSACLLYFLSNSKLPDELELVSSSSKYRELIDRNGPYYFNEDSGRVYSNILIGPYVEWVKYDRPYVYGYNRGSAGVDTNISPEGLFLIDYPAKEIYYLNELNLEKILSGHTPLSLNLKPDVVFSTDDI